MPRTPANLWPALASGDLEGLARDLNPAARETDMPHRTPDSDGDFKTVAEAASPLVQRVTAENADLLYLMLERQAREAEGAPELPDEAPPMDQHEWEVRKAMIALTELPEGDHEARGYQWEHLAELCFSAADVEWRKAKAASRDPITGRVVG